MTPRLVMSALLLFSGVALELLCCLGVLLARGAPNRLHYLTPATILGPLFIAVAVVVSGSGFQASAKALLIVVILLIAGPILSHATGRAVYQQEGDQSQATSREDAL